MRAQRVQGTLFLLCALAVVTASLVLPRMDRSAELITVALLVLVVGVPHGALDPLFVRRLPGARNWGGWAAFGVGYIVLAAAVIGIWVVSPSLFLAGFLVISAIHFSGDPGTGTSAFSRLIYGGAIIVIPTLLHPAETGSLFADLAGNHAASSVLPVLRAIAGPWLALLILCAAAEARRDPLTGAEIAALGILATVAPPLVAFATFFCAMHSPRHILRTADYACDVSKPALWATGLASMLLVFGIVAATWLGLGNVPVDDRLMRIMFVGLGALTVPHMALVERVRLSGWSDITKSQPAPSASGGAGRPAIDVCT